MIPFRQIDEEILIGRLDHLSTAAAAHGAAMFLGKPDRWHEARLLRCAEAHVSRSTLGTDKGPRCLACGGRVFVTFPGDQDGRQLDDVVTLSDGSAGALLSAKRTEVSTEPAIVVITSRPVTGRRRLISADHWARSIAGELRHTRSDDERRLMIASWIREAQADATGLDPAKRPEKPLIITTRPT